MEARSATGRADAVVKTAKTIFVFEFKLTETATAEKDIKQIDNNNYLIPYTAENKKLVKIGVEFSKEERGIKRWSYEL
ncbi:MAG: PD-(D/E)XK nuclease domain-containing protein [Bacteroidales bacterium]|nr:PD-(D/E)XK nuclease domain-containing protein [Bacteroidales bacterium]